MALIINGVGINLSMVNKTSTLVKEKIAYLREHFSEDGKKVVIEWDKSQLRVPPMGHRIVDQSGNTIRIVDRWSPRGKTIPMYGEAVLWRHEGAAEVVYTRRMPVMVDGKVQNIPYEKNVFTGRLTIDLDRQPDLAFFFYCVSPFLRDGENSDGTNMIKFRNRKKEDMDRIATTRRIGRLQDNLLRNEGEGGLSIEMLKILAKEVRIGRAESMTEESLRLMVYDRIVNNQRYSHLFAEVERMMPLTKEQEQQKKVTKEHKSLEEEDVLTNTIPDLHTDMDDDADKEMLLLTTKKPQRKKPVKRKRTVKKKTEKYTPKPDEEQESMVEDEIIEVDE